MLILINQKSTNMDTTDEFYKHDNNPTQERESHKPFSHRQGVRTKTIGQIQFIQ